MNIAKKEKNEREDKERKIVGKKLKRI